MKVSDVRSVADQDATPETPKACYRRGDYLSYDYEDDSFDPDHFDPTTPTRTTWKICNLMKQAQEMQAKMRNADRLADIEISVHPRWHGALH